MTIKDIARISGYGISTVSRALNGHPDVSEETKNKINQIVKEYNFIPNANAKRLKQTSSKSILIIVKGISNMFFASIIEYMQIAMDREGLKASIHYIDERADEINSAKKRIKEQKPLGIIFLGGNLERFSQEFEYIKVPSLICTANSESLKFSNLSSVSVDDFEAGYKATEYLLKKGHKKVGLISGSTEGFYGARLRIDGSIKCLKDNNIEFSEENWVQTRFSLQSAYEATQILLDRNNGITAIFALSDIMAIGAMRAIFDRGLSVPDDISVIGFDGIQMSMFCNPKLTTIKQPEELLAEESVKLMQNMIKKGQTAKHIHLDATLIEGSSVKNR